jgi:hypothetical protein
MTLAEAKLAAMLSPGPSRELRAARARKILAGLRGPDEAA